MGFVGIWRCVWRDIWVLSGVVRLRRSRMSKSKELSGEIYTHIWGVARHRDGLELGRVAGKE